MQERCKVSWFSRRNGGACEVCGVGVGLADGSSNSLLTDDC